MKETEKIHKKKLSKYTASIILFLFFSILTAIIFFRLNELSPTLLSEDVAYYLPFVGWLEEAFLFSVIIPLFALIGTFLGTFLAPVLIFLHKKIIGRNMEYGIEKVPTSPKFRRIFQGFFPGLMAMNFSALIADNPYLQSVMITEWMNNLAMPSDFYQMITFLACIPFTTIISFTLFSALWSLSDAGIVFSNRKSIEKKGKEKPVIGQSIGGWFNYILKGYAGLGALVVYYELVILFFNIFPFKVDVYDSYVNIYLFLMFPVLLPIFTIPPIIIADIYRKKRVNFTIKQAKKLDITKNVRVEIIEEDSSNGIL